MKLHPLTKTQRTQAGGLVEWAVVPPRPAWVHAHGTKPHACYGDNFFKTDILYKSVKWSM